MVEDEISNYWNDTIFNVEGYNHAEKKTFLPQKLTPPPSSRWIWYHVEIIFFGTSTDVVVMIQSQFVFDQVWKYNSVVQKQ